MKSRIRTPSQIIGYGLYLYFLGLSFRNAESIIFFTCSEDDLCFYLELDTKIQTPENINKGKENQGIHHR